MAESLEDKVISRYDEASFQYHRLILLVAPQGPDKTAALQSVAKRMGLPMVNVNLELSRRMLDLAERQRPIKLQRILDDILASASAKDEHAVILDNLEILFDPALKQDPLRLLQHLSRNRTIIASWGGSVDNSHIVYAEPGHPEYRCYAIRDIIIVSPDS